MLNSLNNPAQDDSSHILKVYPHWITDFSKRVVDLNELKSGGPPKDGIPAILNPQFVTASEAMEWLNPREPVIAVEINGKAKAYPLQILIWHEIVNDILNDVPVLVTFCPLCYSAIVFERTVGEEIFTFGVSGLLRNSDLVMYDQKTESFWQQFSGEAIVGEMTGTMLEIIPSQIISFSQFRENYPNGSVLSRETGFTRQYGINPYFGYDDINQTPFLYDGQPDQRLPPNEKVIGVKLGNGKAYPYPVTYRKKVINDEIGDKKIVIFHSWGALSALDERTIENSREAGTTGVFDRELNGMILSFYFKSGYFYDDQTNSKWDVTGRAIEGELKGSKLKRMIFGDYFSFAWFAFYPESSLYTE